MGYSANEYMVRVDFFKPSGKWYCTEAIKWDQYQQVDPERGYRSLNDIFRSSLKAQVGDRLLGMTAVCISPYHEQAYPIMILWDGKSKED